MGSPFLSEGADLLLECPRVARLLVKLPIRLGHRDRPHESRRVEVLHRLFAFPFLDSLAHPGGIDARIYDEMSDVNVLRAKLPCGALRNGAQAEFRGRECRVSDTAAHAGSRPGEEDRSAAAREHQAGRFPARDESRIAGHLPDFAEHAVGSFEQRKIHVGADVEDTNFQRRVLVGVLQKCGQLVLLARVERPRRNFAAACFDLRDQRRELVALPPSRKNGKAFGRKFFGDRATDVVARSYHCRRGISVLQSYLSLIFVVATRERRTALRTLARLITRSAVLFNIKSESASSFTARARISAPAMEANATIAFS